MFRYLRRFLREEDGPTVVEYAVMLAMILMICIGAIVLLGNNTASLWLNNSNSIQTATGS